MTYEEFKGELYRIIMQQEDVKGRKIMLLEKGYTTRDSQILNMIRYINRVTFGREDNVMHGDYLQVIWGEGSIRSVMNWDIQEYYERFQKEGWQGVIPELLLKIQRSGLSTEWLQLSQSGYQQTADRLIVRPIHYETNQYELESGIFWKFGDMALTLYGIVYDAEDDYVTMKLKREITDVWKMEDDTLLENALKNSVSLMPPRLYRSTDLRSKHSLEEGIFMECDGETDQELFHTGSMEGVLGYRLTTTKTINGAIAFFYPGVRERLGELFGDYYVGFTSIHEAVIHPVNHQNPQCMKESIREINEVFPKEEMLSNCIYRYRTRRGDLIEV